MSTYIEATGAGFAPQDQVEMRWEGGRRPTLYAPTHNHGQGHETVFAQLVARELGIPMQTIGLRTAGADFYITGNATEARARSPPWGSVHARGARAGEERHELAAEKLEAAPSDIEFAQGRYRIKGTDRSVAIADLAKDGKLDVAYQNKFGIPPNGCHIAEVEIEPQTGSPIVSYVACDDAGNIVNHQIVEGQVQGGLRAGRGPGFQ